MKTLISVAVLCGSISLPAMAQTSPAVADPSASPATPAPENQDAAAPSPNAQANEDGIADSW
ncbi:hypothetical protein GGR19_003643 [Croceicoccus naphthovorans]|uniref:Uncharacterized protein n=1 Tax=Croceicoccus naphthovorans TaxID=1348774 RepID=A0A0G3XGD4_9SPHN|nr:hypothetical protein AB433_10275 [Croceicoccus naphthovorans]MBB3992194.1 hypothetical protein [Croceicoccus naphthovorans]